MTILLILEVAYNQEIVIFKCCTPISLKNRISFRLLYKSGLLLSTSLKVLPNVSSRPESSASAHLVSLTISPVKSKARALKKFKKGDC